MQTDSNTLPSWQKKLIDERLKAIEENPERIRPIEELFEELDNDLEVIKPS